MRSTSLQFRRPVSRRWNAARVPQNVPAAARGPWPAGGRPHRADGHRLRHERRHRPARLSPSHSSSRAAAPGAPGCARHARRSLRGPVSAAVRSWGLAAAGGLPRRWPPLQPRSPAARSGRSGLSRPGAGVTRASAPAPASHPAAVGATRRSAVRTASLRRIALARRSARIREAPHCTRSVLAVPAALRVRPCAGPCTAAAGAPPLRRGGSEWQFLPPPTAQEAL